MPAECDGWTFALASLAGDPSRFLDRLERLGEVTGSMHVLLASDSSDPDFAAEEPSAESLALVAATLDEEIEAVFAHLPESEVLEPIAGRGEEVRERLRVLSRMTEPRPRDPPSTATSISATCSGRDPTGSCSTSRARPTAASPSAAASARRCATSPSMLRSFAYAASATVLAGGRPPPDGLGGAGAGELPARLLLRGRAERVHPRRRGRRQQLLEIFELEKAVDELRHELAVRPEWLPIPVAAIERLLAQPSGE